ncbi:VgrG-related protein [Actinosynnema sp. NPDC047251]|uniref:Rhs element Vgr protein n=1 Tax=Saccharothrix espanaensis (strain ATCC 51144 / DSM 44229 / JCM 9112 / NBRC 15066 / NRRL 15764) TaxID=1179773 RepID=K0KAV7_SACES|nr:VgrG-related protein [Saccharothrix espanaensis]CCH33758.1 Rhs element Vgr protein [Saccharothrix espanaensis DSM 44229]
MANESFANTLVVEVESAPLPEDVKPLLTHAFVDGSRNLPDVFVLRFRDPGHVVLAKGKFTIGAKIALKVQTTDPGGPQPLMSGEITAVGVQFDSGGTFTEVRGYDLAHRLFRGRRTVAYPGMTVADIVRKVAQRATIPVGTIDDVKGVGGRPNTQISQDNLSDWEFLSRLAGAVGAQITVLEGKLDFRLPDEPTGAPAKSAKARSNPLVLEMHRTLLSLRASITAAEQVPEVRVRGWDYENKKEIIATKKPDMVGTEVTGVDPVALAGKFGSPPYLATGPYRAQGEVDAVAAALSTQLGGACAELAGVARGNPKLRAGTAVALTNIGDPFAGKYTLTSTRHLFAEQGGYTTEFTVSGRQERSLYGLANGGGGREGRTGVVPAVVTDARDPAKLGRVKVKFPWLSDEFASGWARTVQTGAGLGRGALVLPEVGDEVLVGFEHGDFDAPYVLGGLYNSKDTAPTLTQEPIDGGTGEVTVRGFVSRKGHKVEFVEDEGILISSGDGKFVVKLDQKAQVVEVTSGKAVVVKAQNGITLDAGTGPLELKGQKITAQAQTAVEVKGAQVSVSGSTGVKVEGATVSVAGQAQAEVTASGVLTVRGSLVKIN